MFPDQPDFIPEGIPQDLFAADLNMGEISDDPFSVPDNDYLCVIDESIVKKSQAGNWGWRLVFQIMEGSHSGETINEWKAIPDSSAPRTEKWKQQFSFIKQRLIQLRIPEVEMLKLLLTDAQSLEGIENVVVTIKKGRVNKVKIDPNFTPPSDLVSDDPFTRV